MTDLDRYRLLRTWRRRLLGGAWTIYWLVSGAAISVAAITGQPFLWVAALSVTVLGLLAPIELAEVLDNEVNRVFPVSRQQLAAELEDADARVAELRQRLERVQ